MDQKNKCVRAPSPSKAAAAGPWPTERARLHPGHDSLQVALAAVCRADVVAEMWHFSAVMGRVQQPWRGGGAALPALAASGFPHTWSRAGKAGAGFLAGAWRGTGRLREDVRGLVSRAGTRSIPFPPFWLEHAAPTPPPGPSGTDTALNRGRRRRGQARHAAKPAPEKGSARCAIETRTLAERTSPGSPDQLERRGRTRPAVPEHPPSPVAAAPTKARLPPGCTGHGTGLLFGVFAGSAAEPSVELPAWE